MCVVCRDMFVCYVHTPCAYPPPPPPKTRRFSEVNRISGGTHTREQKQRPFAQQNPRRIDVRNKNTDQETTNIQSIYVSCIKRDLRDNALMQTGSLWCSDADSRDKHLPLTGEKLSGLLPTCVCRRCSIMIGLEASLADEDRPRTTGPISSATPPGPLAPPRHTDIAL